MEKALSPTRGALTVLHGSGVRPDRGPFQSSRWRLSVRRVAEPVTSNSETSTGESIEHAFAASMNACPNARREVYVSVYFFKACAEESTSEIILTTNSFVSRMFWHVSFLTGGALGETEMMVSWGEVKLN